MAHVEEEWMNAYSAARIKTLIATNKTAIRATTKQPGIAWEL